MTQIIASVARTAAATIVATVTLIGLGTSFKIIGNAPAGQFSGGSGSVLQQWTTSGAAAGKLNASGSLVLSGTVVVGHRKTGSGYLLIRGTDGGRLCVNDIDGTGCTCFAGNNGTQQSWTGTSGECDPRDAL